MRDNFIFFIGFALFGYALYLSSATGFPYFIYSFIVVPIILVILFYLSGLYDEYELKKEKDLLEKKKHERNIKIQLEIELEKKKKQEEWDNLTNEEKEIILAKNKKEEQERREKVHNEIRESIKAEINAKKLAEENKLREIRLKEEEEENERIRQIKLNEEKEEKERENERKRIEQIKEQNEKKEREQKETIKRKILENERKKQLESEAIQELLDAGLIDNNHYSGKNIRESIPTEVKVAVWQRDKERCVNCFSNSNLEFDHIIPISKGGANSIKNIQLLCRNCNRTKSNKIM